MPPGPGAVPYTVLSRPAITAPHGLARRLEVGGTYEARVSSVVGDRTGERYLLERSGDF